MALIENARDGDTTLLGRRERKKRATRLALKAAALDLVGERGYDRVTVEDIADAVDVSVRTFYNFFPSKEAAIVGDDPELLKAARVELLALPRTLSPFDAVRTILIARLRAIGEDIDLTGEDHRTWLRRFAVVRSEPAVLLAYAKHISMAERSLTDAVVEWLGGDERLRAYASLVTTSAMGVMRVASANWDGEGGTASLVEFASAAFTLLGRGLSADLSADGELPGSILFFSDNAAPSAGTEAS